MTEHTITASQMKEIDRLTIEEIGIPSMVLMERAALGVAEHVLEKTERSQRILAVCGKGNNGADGVAAGRMLFLNERKVDVLLIGDEETATEETKQQLRIARNIGLPILTEESAVKWTDYSVFLDALFGIGLSREVEGPYKRVIATINALDAKYVVAVDIASGLSGDTGEVMGTALQADATVTFGWKKAGMESAAGRSVSGEVSVTDIGYPLFVLEKVTQQ